MSRLRSFLLYMAAIVARTMPKDGDPDRVLLVRPDHLGDLLFVGPALRFLRESMPEAHLAMLVGPWGAPVAERSPYLDAVLVCDFPWFNRQPRSSALGPYLLLQREARRLHAAGYGTVACLRFDFWWGALLGAMGGASRRIGYDLPLVRPFLSEPVDWQPERHAVHQNLRLAEQVAHRSAATFHPELEWKVRPEAAAWVDRYLIERGVKAGEMLAVLQPGSGAAIKSWTPEGFAAVAAHLQQAHGARIIITGTAGERPLAQAVAAMMPSSPPLVAAGDTDLDALAALLCRSRLVVGVDSGPLHLAVALGVPTVHLFGPADPVLFGPFGPPERHVVVKAGLRCIPCRRLGQPAPGTGVADCMQAIPARQVIDAAEALLGRTEQGE